MGEQLPAESQSHGEGEAPVRDLPKLESHLLGYTLQYFARVPHWLKLTKHQSARTTGKCSLWGSAIYAIQRGRSGERVWKEAGQ